MTVVGDNTLHGDPGIETRALHGQVPAGVTSGTPMQRERATGRSSRRARPDAARSRARSSTCHRSTACCRRRYRRKEPARLPEVSEPELVRHYVSLSKRNFDLDSGFYPLGSCTMKHNPRLHERVAALAGPRPPAPAAGPRSAPRVPWS